MRLQKIQKFLKENNIDYTYSSSTYQNNEFGTIDIKSDKIGFTSISEISGIRGNTLSGIIAFYTDRKTNKKENLEFSSQVEIINRIKSELSKK